MAHVCSKCQFPIQIFNFCPFCGASLSLSGRCTGCHRQTPVPDFCSVCGNDLRQTTDSAARSHGSEKAPRQLEYEVHGDGTVTVTRLNDSKATSVTLPTNTVAIGERAFAGSKIMEISLPEGIRLIDTEAFADCRMLRAVRLPSTLSQISRAAFKNCTMLYTVGERFPEELTFIDDEAFSGCISLKLPNDTTFSDSPPTETSDSFRLYLDHSQFEYSVCDGNYTVKGLKDPLACPTEITVPSFFTAIGDSAFRGCASLTSVIISDSVTDIGDHAFAQCKALTGVRLPQGIKKLPTGIFSQCSSLSELIIPQSVEEISGFAFNGCRSLSEIHIPESVKRMGNYVFQGCVSLRAVRCKHPHAPSGWSELWNGSLTAGNIPEEAIRWTESEIQSHRAVSKKQQALLDGFYYRSCGDKYIITGIKDKNATKAVLPSDTVRIESRAFYGCEQLESVTLPEGLEFISSEVFAYCKQLKRIHLPGSLRVISDFAFVYSGLTELNIPASVSEMGDYVIAGCDSLTHIKCEKNKTPPSWSRIWNCVFPKDKPHTAQVIWGE
ncbi:MAG: leucine-rich repeat protein [Clostridia bacterium]|nr:leucine-rich repeat protein [Clostridia bacterium]